MKGEKFEGKSCSCGNSDRYKNSNQCVYCAKDAANFRNDIIRSGLVTQDQVAECYEQGKKAESSQDNPYPTSELGKRCAWFAGFNDSHAI